VKLNVRRAEARDGIDIHRLICELATYEREPNAVEVSPHELIAQLTADEPPFECLVCEVDASVVAFALFFHNYSTWRGRRGLYLEDLFVTPTHRGRGIGRRLLTELAKIASERGCARMEWSVLDWNESAIGFYQSLGAQPMAGWTVFRLTGEALGELARKE